MDYLKLNELVELVGRDSVPAEQAMRFIHSASRHVDALTFGRINKYGFDRLTEFQQQIIKESTALLTRFEYENADILSSGVSSYSINGVSVSFGGDKNWNVQVKNGVVVTNEIYNLLSQSGLTTLNFCI